MFSDASYFSSFKERGLVLNEELGEDGERLALHVLRKLPLVQEHIETRPLYNPLQPGIEQGRLQMFVDIYSDLVIPPPPDVRPRTPKKYELRIVVWNTKDVILEEENMLGEKMSDIYVKGWMAGIDKKQETDVHYRSLDGEGNFNWRFVLPFEYMPAEGCMVVKKKEHFWSLDETELKMPPVLVMQIWDNDLFSADDFLGTLELNLDRMPKASRKSRDCSLKKIEDPNYPDRNIEHVSLFELKRVRGFWPCYNDDTGERELTGKIEMEIEIVDEEEAEEKPVGQGQQDPNQFPHLEPPKRPATSFLWITSPWKTLKHIIWKNYKWYIISAIVIIIIALLLVLFFYSTPGATVNKMFGFN